ncbi:MAG: hypothetical protein E7548_00510 [Ruminococcaceae bacterium]|nr:hypothetical protein [Oscillospiraceae bacterium]
MVKGVNKKIIEINNTENEFFEKIILYVSPKAGAPNSAKVKRAANELVSNLSGDSPKTKGLREILEQKKKQKRHIIIVSICVAALLTVAALLIFLLI